MRGEACCGHSTCGGPSVIISVLLVEELKLVVMMGCSWAVKPLSPSEAHVVSTSSEPCPVPGARDSSLYWVLTSVLSKRLGEPHCAESQPLTEVPPWTHCSSMHCPSLPSITLPPDCSGEMGCVSWLLCPQGGCPSVIF